VSVESAGFKRAENPEVALQIQQMARLDFALEIGSVSETLAVTAAAPLLVTDDVTLGQTVDQRKILELPLSGRNVTSLTLLGTGMASSSNGISNTVANILTGGVTMTANGMRTSANQYSVDGANVNVGFYNFPGFVPVVDAVEEFKVRTGNYSAEYGGFGGAHVDYSLRSGANTPHLTLWEFLRNDKLDARNAFAITKPVLRQNQFGGIASGPVIRNKTFFMVTYQGFRRRNQAIPQATVPSEAQRAGDLSRTVDGKPEAPIRDPLSGEFFPDNVIPRSRFSSTTQRVLSYYPLPNQVGPVNYRALTSVPRDENAVLTKFDHVFSSANRFTARYVFQEADGINSIPVIADFGTTMPTRAQNVALTDTHTFSPSTLADVRISWNRLSMKELSPRNGSQFDVRKEFNMTIPSTAVPGAIENAIPSFGVTGFAGIGDSNVAPLNQPDENYQIAGSLSVLKGKHALKTGIDFRRTRSARFHGRFTNGSVSFQPGNEGGSGHAFADLLLGLPRQSSIVNIPSVVDLRQTRAHLFLADTWTLSPKLTLSLGLRYELNASPWETYGRIPVFDFTPPGAFHTLEPGAPLFTGDHNNFAPRIGAAYRPFDKTVVRAAYGVFYSEPKLLGLNVRGINPPFIISQAFFSSKANPLQASNPFPIGLAAAGGVPAPNSYQPNRRTPYVQTWSFNLQRQFGNNVVVEVGYVGNIALKMGRSVTLNVPLTPQAGPIQARRPLTGFGPASHFQYDSNSNYNALQFRAEKQFSRGFSLLAAYTFGRNTDLSGDEQTGSTIDPRNLNRDRGLSESQIKHRLTLTYVWQLPFGPGKPLLNRGGLIGGVLGGWELSGVTLMQSGGVLTIDAPGDMANVGLGTRPNRVCDGGLDNPGVTRWFDTGCFAMPAAFTFGNSGRGILVGPGKQAWDL
ncbi:MAG: TonB-dependent receptor, partial [Acidobacteria bacterium]|nr:TonB-dependent receptor [Acidobacteriota bacterium]